MIAGTTDRTRTAPCDVCGAVTDQYELFAPGVTPWWMAHEHTAPCGAPCVGGGVRPLCAEERPPGVSGIAHAHLATTCGTPGCGGGVR